MFSLLYIILLLHTHKRGNFYDYIILFSDITLGFLQEVYDGGNEGSDQLPNMPCRVNISLHNTTIEAPLTLRLIPQTIPEYVADNGPPPTAVLRGANASRKKMFTIHS